jgi:nucleoside 2-deoxyribosyltransferase
MNEQYGNKEIFNIYIATSWKNQHAVEMLTDILEQTFQNVCVRSFVRNANEENLRDGKPEDINSWIWSEKGLSSFNYDTGWASKADLVIAISNLGKDSCVEIGIAFAYGIPLYHLWAKGEDIGLMRRCFTDHFECYNLMIEDIKRAFAHRITVKTH